MIYYNIMSALLKKRSQSRLSDLLQWSESSNPRKNSNPLLKPKLYPDLMAKYILKTHIISHYYTDKTMIEYVIKNIRQSLLPIVIFTNKTIIPPNNLYYSLLSNTSSDGILSSFDYKLALIEKYIGAFISPDYEPEKNGHRMPTNKIISLHITSSLLPNYLDRQMMYTKWYSSDTQHALEGAIQFYEPKIVVELGVYLGASTVSLLTASKKKIRYYGFDYFTHVCTDPPHITYSPLDKFFLEYPKLDTAVANVIPFAKKHDINFILHDVLRSNEYLLANNIIPDLLFIDSIKNQNNLTLIIHKYIMINPNIVIVGDDMVCGQVKPALSDFDYISFGINAYLITTKPKLRPENYPSALASINNYPRYLFTPEEIKLIPKIMRSFT